MRFALAVENGDISKEDADAAKSFLDMAGHPSFSIYLMGRTGKLAHLQGHEGYEATMRSMDKLGLGQIEFDGTTAQPVEE